MPIAIEHLEEPGLVASFDHTLVKHPDQMFFPDPAQLPALVLPSAPTVPTRTNGPIRLTDGPAIMTDFFGVAPWDGVTICHFAWIQPLEE